MHVYCFHGGSRVARYIGVIRGFTKNMKAMSLKAKASGGQARRPEAGGLQRQPQDYKDGSGGVASASAKIAPAQPQEEAYGDEHRHDRQLRREEEEEGQGDGGGGKKQEYCDKCCSPLLDDDGAAEAAAEDTPVLAKEWVAEPEPGVLMTLAPRPDGTNRLRRMRFREELFDAWAAQCWWADNSDRIVDLYSVIQSDDDEDDAAAAMPVTPCQSEEEEELPSGSPSTSNISGVPSSGSGSAGTVGSPILGLVTAPDTRSGSKTPPPPPPPTKTAAAQLDGNGIGDHQPRTQWREWVEEYEAGVFITVRAYPGHPLQLRHVELSRERFGEVKARVWWQENKERLRSLYSFSRRTTPAFHAMPMPSLFTCRRNVV